VTARIRSLQTAVTTPGYILLAVVAQPLIGVLYDDRYAAAGLYLSFLALNGAISVLPMIYQNALLASGDSRAHAFVMGVASALKIAATVAGFYIGGPVGMIVGVGVAEVLVFAVSATIASRQGFASLSIDILNLGVVLTAYAVALLVLL
jgi:O-antigen/teichoic acid export membrane protein